MSVQFKKFRSAALGAVALIALHQAASAATVESALDVLGSDNLFVNGNLGSAASAYSSDSQGAIIVGGNAYLSNFATATNSQANGYSLIVGKSLQFSNGSVTSGSTYVGGSALLTNVSTGAITTGGSLGVSNLTVGGTATAGGSLGGLNAKFTGNVNASGSVLLTNSSVAGSLSAGISTAGGSVSLNYSNVSGSANIGSSGSLSLNGSSTVGGINTSNASLPTASAAATAVSAPLNLSATWGNLVTESQSLGALTQTSGATVVSQWGGLTLTGTNAKQDVFTLSASQLSGINDFTLTAPSGATVIINVTGSSVDWENSGVTLKGVSASHVLFNFTDATSIIFSGIGEEGSILAPYATIQGSNGSLNGSIVAAALKGSIQLNSDGFTGAVSAVPLPGASLLFGSSLLGLGAFRARRRAKR